MNAGTGSWSAAQVGSMVTGSMNPYVFLITLSLN